MDAIPEDGNPATPAVAPDRFSGGCECGSIRYEGSSRPIAISNCHCRACQQITGGAYVPVGLLKAETFRLTRGTLRHHFTKTERMGRHKRGFCGDCGSRITSAQPWDLMDPARPKHPKYKETP